MQKLRRNDVSLIIQSRIQEQQKKQLSQTFTLNKTGKQITDEIEKSLLKLLQTTSEGEAGDLFETGIQFFVTLYNLISKEKIELNIPDSVAFGIGFEEITLMYTKQDGTLGAREKIEWYQWPTIAKNLFDLNSYENFAVPGAITRAMNTDYNRAHSSLKESLAEWPKPEKTPKEWMVQRFIRAKGRKASKLRVIWKLKGGFRYFTITNRNRLDSKQDKDPKTSVIATCGSLNEAHDRYGEEFIPIINYSQVVESKQKQEMEQMQFKQPIIDEEEEETNEVSQEVQELDVENTTVYHREHFPVIDRSQAGKRVKKMSDILASTTDPESYVPYDDFPTDNLSVHPWIKGRTPSEVLAEAKLKRQKLLNPQEEESAVTASEKDSSKTEVASKEQVQEEEEKKQKEEEAAKKPSSSFVKQVKGIDNFVKKHFKNRRVPKPPVKNLYNKLHKIGKPQDTDEQVNLDAEGIVQQQRKLRDRFCTNSKNNAKSIAQEVRLNYESVNRQMHHLMKVLEKYVLVTGGFEFTEFVCDFIEDSRGIWYFLKVKSYKYQIAVRVIPPVPRVRATKKIKCPGQYCSQPRSEQSNEDGPSLFDKRETTNQYFWIMKSIVVQPKSKMPKISKAAAGRRRTRVSQGAAENMRDFDKIQVCSNCYLFYKEIERKKQVTQEDFEQSLKKKQIRERKLEKVVAELDPEQLHSRASTSNTFL